MTNRQMRELVITTAVAATVSAIASSLVALAISRIAQRYEEQRLAAIEQDLSLREYYLQQAVSDMPWFSSE